MERDDRQDVVGVRKDYFFHGWPALRKLFSEFCKTRMGFGKNSKDFPSI